MLFVGEKSKPVKRNAHRSRRADGGKHILNAGKFFRRGLADKFQSYVKIFGPHPARRFVFCFSGDRTQLREQSGEALAHRSGNLERNKKAHGSGSPRMLCGRLAAVIEEMNAYHVQRDLRSLPTDHLAVTGKVQFALLHAGGMGKRNVHSANGFFLATSAGPSNTSDSNA